MVNRTRGVGPAVNQALLTVSLKVNQNYLLTYPCMAYTEAGSLNLCGKINNATAFFLAVDIDTGKLTGSGRTYTVYRGDMASTNVSCGFPPDGAVTGWFSTSHSRGDTYGELADVPYMTNANLSAPATNSSIYYACVWAYADTTAYIRRGVTSICQSRGKTNIKYYAMIIYGTIQQLSTLCYAYTTNFGSTGSLSWCIKPNHLAVFFDLACSRSHIFALGKTTENKVAIEFITNSSSRPTETRAAIFNEIQFSSVNSGSIQSFKDNSSSIVFGAFSSGHKLNILKIDVNTSKLSWGISIDVDYTISVCEYVLVHSNGNIYIAFISSQSGAYLTCVSQNGEYRWTRAIRINDKKTYSYSYSGLSKKDDGKIVYSLGISSSDSKGEIETFILSPDDFTNKDFILGRFICKIINARPVPLLASIGTAVSSGIQTADASFSAVSGLQKSNADILSVSETR